MTVVFALILVYLLVHGILLLTRDRIQAFDVGTPVRDNVAGSYTGILLREEHAVVSTKEGYISCFCVSGERLSAGGTVCTLDDSGTFQDALRSLYFGEQMLSDKSKVRIRDTVRSSMYTYSRMDFESAGRIGTSIRAAVLNGLIRDADSVASAALYASCTPVMTEESGFVLWELDGYEYAVPSSLTKEDFTAPMKEAVNVKTGDKVLAGQFLYKLVPDNKFRLVFPLTEQEAVRFSGRTQLTVRFTDGSSVTGSFSEEHGADGTPLGVLSFQKYGANYLDSRRVSFFLLDTAVEGYKIPESAILSKHFYTVDKAFITEGGGSGARGVLVEEDGKAVFREVTVYTQDTDEDPSNDFIIGTDTAYISGEALEPGTVLIAPETESGSSAGKRMTLGVQAVLEGVYQINNGYCVFRPVVRLAASLETAYVMVSSKVRSGISDYDRIVLDAADASEYELIYK